ncbi:MAG: MFS transporter [Spongiibacteraceae bacterium]
MKNNNNVPSTNIPDPYQKKNYRYYVLGMLTTTYMFSFVDRQILAILQEPIKAELGLSDTQLGLLSGFAFAIFYIVLGLPIARWADRGIRRNIIVYALGLWSVMTALCGLAQNYTQLLLARMGVGVGEAGCAPASHSMIADMFPIKGRVTALATLHTGVNAGMLVGFLLGGWVLEFFGWRAALLTVGIPGLLLALVIRVTVREPIRASAGKPLNTVVAHPTLLQTARLLFSKRTFRFMVFGGALCAFTSYGLFSWMPSFLSRSYGLSPGIIGTWLALSIGVGGAIGTFLSGFIADKLGARDRRWYCWAMALTSALSLPFVAGVFLADDSRLSLLLFIVPAALAAGYVAPLITVTHSLVDNNMRAVSSALVLFILNIIGLGIGPVAIGYLSDLLVSGFGLESLRYALLILMSLSFVACIFCFLWSSRYIRSEMD